MTIPRGSALTSLLALMCSAIPRFAESQSTHMTLAAERSPVRAVAVTRRWFDDPSTAGVIAGRILATGAPSTYQIISVPIPDRLPRHGEGRVEIVAREGFTILGTRRWSLPALEGKTKVIGIIGISASAHAGLITAAEVQFHVAGTPTVTVAVEIDISLVRELAIRMTSGPLHARAGGRVTFSYALVNTGNATESVETLVAAPTGWKTNQPSGAPAAVQPGQSVERQVVISIPRDVGMGSFFLHLDVIDRRVVRSSIPIAVEILDGLSRQAAAGPEITIAVARASDASGRGSTVTTTSVRGPLFDSVRIEARFAIGETEPGPYGQALSRLGSYRSTPSLVLSSPTGSVALGAAGNSFSDLTGLYAYGKGAALDAHRPGWSLVGLGAVSTPSPSLGKSQPMLGLRGDVDVGQMRIMSSLSHLRGGEQSGRELDAAGLGASVVAGFGTTIQGEVARRRFAGGNGTGWSTEISRNDAQIFPRICHDA